MRVWHNLLRGSSGPGLDGQAHNVDTLTLTQEKKVKQGIHARENVTAVKKPQMKRTKGWLCKRSFVGIAAAGGAAILLKTIQLFVDPELCFSEHLYMALHVVNNVLTMPPYDAWTFEELDAAREHMNRLMSTALMREELPVSLIFTWRLRALPLDKTFFSGPYSASTRPPVGVSGARKEEIDVFSLIQDPATEGFVSSFSHTTRSQIKKGFSSSDPPSSRPFVVCSAERGENESRLCSSCAAAKDVSGKRLERGACLCDTSPASSSSSASRQEGSDDSAHEGFSHWRNGSEPENDEDDEDRISTDVYSGEYELLPPSDVDSVDFLRAGQHMPQQVLTPRKKISRKTKKEQDQGGYVVFFLLGFFCTHFMYISQLVQRLLTSGRRMLLQLLIPVGSPKRRLIPPFPRNAAAYVRESGDAIEVEAGRGEKVVKKDERPAVDKTGDDKKNTDGEEAKEGLAEEKTNDTRTRGHAYEGGPNKEERKVETGDDGVQREGRNGPDDRCVRTCNEGTYTRNKIPETYKSKKMNKNIYSSLDKKHFSERYHRRPVFEITLYWSGGDGLERRSHSTEEGQIQSLEEEAEGKETGVAKRNTPNDRERQPSATTTTTTSIASISANTTTTDTTPTIVREAETKEKEQKPDDEGYNEVEDDGKEAIDETFEETLELAEHLKKTFLFCSANDETTPGARRCAGVHTSNRVDRKRGRRRDRTAAGRTVVKRTGGDGRHGKETRGVGRRNLCSTTEQREGADMYREDCLTKERHRDRREESAVIEDEKGEEKTSKEGGEKEEEEKGWLEKDSLDECSEKSELEEHRGGLNEHEGEDKTRKCADREVQRVSYDEHMYDEEPFTEVDSATFEFLSPELKKELEKRETREIEEEEKRKRKERWWGLFNQHRLPHICEKRGTSEAVKQQHEMVSRTFYQ